MKAEQRVVEGEQWGENILAFEAERVFGKSANKE